MRLALGIFLVLSSLGTLLAQPVCSFVGDASNLGGDCYQITDNNEWELGAVWFNDQLDLTQPFTINVDVELGSTDANGADGIVFVMQSVGPAAIGVAGGGLGFEGFNPSFGVEIDTWQNVDVGDPVADHVAFLRDGVNLHTAPYFNLAGPVSARLDGANIEDGQPHQFKLEWDPVLQIIRFYFDCEERLVLQEDIIEEIFDGQSDVWWGFTGSTGGSSNQQSVCITSSAVGLPPEHGFCAGGGVQLVLQSTEEGSVSWDPVEGLSNPNSSMTSAQPNETTLYTATWTDVCGETLTAETLVEVWDVPEPDLPEEVEFCPGEEVTLEAQAPADAASILWTDGTQTAEWMGTEAGWQGVAVESAEGCSGTDSTWVVALSAWDLDLPEAPDLCAGEELLIAWPEEGTDWMVNGVPMPDGWLATAGEATITALDATTGCALETTVTIGLIDPPGPTLSQSVAICTGQSVALDLNMDPTSAVVWSPVEGLDDAAAIQPEASPTTTTEYTAAVTNVCGVVDELTIAVAVLEEPAPELPDSAVLCGSDQLQLDVEPLVGVADPLWSDGSTGWQWQGDAPGWIGVTVTVLPGCAGSDSTWVTVEPVEAPSIEVGALCPGEFAFVPFPDGWTDWTLDGEPQLQGGLTVTEPGVYFAEAVSAASGCPVSVGIVVPSGALPQMGLPEVVEFCLDQVVYLETGVPDPVLWNDGLTGPSRQVNEAGTYIATHTTDCGSVSDTVSVVEVPCGCLVFAPSAFTPDGDLINDAWRPTLDCEPEEYALKIFDRWGALIWETENPEEYWTGGHRADNRPLDEKLYYVRDGMYAYQLTFRDPTSRVRRIERKSGHVLIIR